eukprot:g26439.t1
MSNAVGVSSGIKRSSLRAARRMEEVAVLSMDGPCWAREAGRPTVPGPRPSPFLSRESSRKVPEAEEEQREEEHHLATEALPDEVQAESHSSEPEQTSSSKASPLPDAELEPYTSAAARFRAEMEFLDMSSFPASPEVQGTKKGLVLLLPSGWKRAPEAAYNESDDSEYDAKWEDFCESPGPIITKRCELTGGYGKCTHEIYAALSRDGELVEVQALMEYDVEERNVCDFHEGQFTIRANKRVNGKTAARTCLFEWESLKVMQRTKLAQRAKLMTVGRPKTLQTTMTRWHKRSQEWWHEDGDKQYLDMFHPSQLGQKLEKLEARDPLRDSRCVLARGEKAKNMSRDHKPELKSEKTRILQAGGFVSADGRVDGNLNLSRSLGDFAYKKDRTRKAVQQKISAEAEVKRVALGPADKFLAIGCDGIFEKVSSQQLVGFLLSHIRNRRRSKAPLSLACSAFLDVNLAKNPHKEPGSITACSNTEEWRVAMALCGELMMCHLEPGIWCTASAHACDKVGAWLQALSIFEWVSDRTEVDGALAGSVLSSLSSSKGASCALELLRCLGRQWQPAVPEVEVEAGSAGVLCHRPGIVVVNKASGESTESLLLRCSKSFGIQLRLASRLDAPTSGVLPLACGESAGKYLQAQFAGRLVRKDYICLCAGPSLGEMHSSAVISQPLLTTGQDGINSRTIVSKIGRPAKTAYVVQARYWHSAPPVEGVRSLIRLHPHQDDQLHSEDMPFGGPPLWEASFAAYRRGRCQAAA